MVTMIAKETGVVAVNVYSALVSFNSALMPRMVGDARNTIGEGSISSFKDTKGVVSYPSMQYTA